MDNLFSSLPANLEKEVYDELLRSRDVRIERIISKGHTAPEVGWFDQVENEWVVVLQGAGTILFEDGREVTLKSGDYINIPSHARHKVTWTVPNELTVWLAVFYT